MSGFIWYGSGLQERGAEPSGGTDYPRTASETLTTSDSVTAVVNHPRATSETLTTSDSPASAAGHPRATSDTVAGTDSPTSVAGHPRAVSDTVAGTDSPASTAGHPRATSDTVAGTDSLTAVQVLARALAETLTTSDSPARVAGHPRATADTVAGTDSLSRVVGFVRAPSDTVTGTDALTAAQVLARTPSDTVSGTDSPARVVGASRSASESLTTTDTASPRKTIAWQFSSVIQLPNTDTSLTLNISSSSFLVNEWVYAWVLLNATPTGFACTGWTSLVEGQIGTGEHYQLWRRRKQSGDTTFNMTWTGAAKGGVVLAQWSGLDDTSPNTTPVVVEYDAATPNLDTGTSDPNIDYGWAAVFVGHRNNTLGITFTDGAGIDERFDAPLNASSGSSPYQTAYIGDSNGRVTDANHSYSVTASAGTAFGSSLLMFLVPGLNTSQNYPRTGTDTVDGSDSPARVQGSVRATSESIPTTESPARVQGSIRATDDTVAATDSPARVVGAVRATSETVDGSDSTARQVSFSRTADETVSHPVVVNLADDPSFEAGITDWANPPYPEYTNQVLSHDTTGDYSRTGDGALVVDYDQSDQDPGWIPYMAVDGPMWPAIEGVPYTGTIYITSSTSVIADKGAYLNFFDASLNPIASVGPDQRVVGDGPARVLATRVAPRDAVWVSIEPFVNFIEGEPLTGTVTFDDAMMTRSRLRPIADSRFDSDTEGWTAFGPATTSVDQDAGTLLVEYDVLAEFDVFGATKTLPLAPGAYAFRFRVPESIGVDPDNGGVGVSLVLLDENGDVVGNDQSFSQFADPDDGYYISMVFLAAGGVRSVRVELTGTIGFGTGSGSVRVDDVMLHAISLWDYFEDTQDLDTDTADRSVVLARSLSETVDGDDSLTSVAGLIRAVEETLSTSDDAVGGFTLARTAEDTVTGDDDLTAAVTLIRALAETLTTTDSPARSVESVRSPSDTVTGTDTPTRVQGNPRNPADTVDGSDGVARTVHNTRRLSDTYFTDDVADRAVANSRSVSESVPTTESLASSAAHPRAVSETVSGTDAAARLAGYKRTVIDTVQALDAATRALELTRTTSEAIPTTDAATRSIALFRAGDDTVTGGDVLVAHVGRVRSASETVTGSDSPARQIALARTATDTRATTDALTALKALQRAATETLTTLDTPARVQGSKRSVVETTTVTDAVARVIALVRSVTDTRVTTDAATRSVTLARAIFEAITVIDEVRWNSAHTRSVSESIPTSDSVARHLVLSRTRTEFLTTSDTATKGAQNHVRFSRDNLVNVQLVGSKRMILVDGEPAIRITDAYYARL